MPEATCEAVVYSDQATVDLFSHVDSVVGHHYPEIKDTITEVSGHEIVHVRDDRLQVVSRALSHYIVINERLETELNKQHRQFSSEFHKNNRDEMVAEIIKRKLIVYPILSNLREMEEANTFSNIREVQSEVA